MKKGPPVRIRIERVKGFNLQALSRSINGRDAIMVTRPGKFGNPFVVGRDGTAGQCVRLFRDWFFGLPYEKRREMLMALSGKNLACWCRPGGSCHADVYLENPYKVETHGKLERV